MVGSARTALWAHCSTLPSNTGSARAHASHLYHCTGTNLQPQAAPSPCPSPALGSAGALCTCAPPESPPPHHQRHQRPPAVTRLPQLHSPAVQPSLQPLLMLQLLWLPVALWCTHAALLLPWLLLLAPPRPLPSALEGPWEHTGASSQHQRASVSHPQQPAASCPALAVAACCPASPG